MIFIIAGEPIARLFSTSQSVITVSINLLVVAAVFQVADAIQVSAICALRGMSDVRVPAVIAALAYWVVAVPLGYWLGFSRNLGATGIWIGLATGLIVAAIALLWRFHLKSRPLARPLVTIPRPSPRPDALSLPA